MTKFKKGDIVEYINDDESKGAHSEWWGVFKFREYINGMLKCIRYKNNKYSNSIERWLDINGVVVLRERNCTYYSLYKSQIIEKNLSREE